MTAAARSAGDGTTPRLPDGVVGIREEPAAGAIPLFVHPTWRRELDWVVQGTTGRGTDSSADMGLFGATPVVETMRRWRTLRTDLSMRRAVHSLQVHEDRILVHGDGPPGLAVSEGFDGHVTDRSGLLLTVSVADCVPIFLVAPAARRIAILHGGWRGTARRILHAGLDRLSGDSADIHVHLGPAICGRCYEVGPEVHEALGLPAPAGPAPVDVRAVLARQAVDAGVAPDHISISEHCTRCGDGFFSHRAGEPGRQLGVLGLRP